MRILNTIIIFILLVCSVKNYAAEKYWVIFTDKAGVSFNPHSYFDSKAINRRQKYNLPIYDETDLPVNQDYVKVVAEYGKVGSQSRWLNAVVVEATEENIYSIEQLCFVQEVLPIITTDKNYRVRTVKSKSKENVELLEGQINSMQGEVFAQNNINGKGVRIAIFDAGFPSVDTHPAFKHIRDENRIIKTWDFVKDRENVYAHNAHGTMVLGCIAGKYENKNIGLATSAEFLLARTETWTEFISEEENWLAAAEWADRNGADIISSSLGYTYHRYFTSEMDGTTSLVVKAANMARAKGMLVVNAMGNDGDKKWSLMCTPADGDSVLAIGGIDPEQQYHISFSSYGPTADKRLKPNVSAYGKVYTANKKDMSTAYGTSFATPLVAGFAACVLQLNPQYTSDSLFKHMERSGNLFPYYDYAHGYGIPQANYFFKKESPDTLISFHKAESNLYIHLLDKALNDFNEKDYLYYHIDDGTGVLLKYGVLKLFKENSKPVYTFHLNKYSNDCIYRVYYRNAVIEYKQNTLLQSNN